LDVKQLPIDSRWYLVRPGGKRLSLVAETFLNFLRDEGQESVLEELRKRF